MYGNMLLGVKPCFVRQFNSTYIYNQLAPAQTLPTSTCNQSQATFLACGLCTCQCNAPPTPWGKMGIMWGLEDRNPAYLGKLVK